MNYIFLIVVVAIVVALLAVATFTKFTLDNSQYDRLKWLVVRWHYITAFIALLVKLFDFPLGAETVEIVIGIGVAMAGILGISNKNYGEDEVIEDDDEDFDEDGEE